MEIGTIFRFRGPPNRFQSHLVHRTGYSAPSQIDPPGNAPLNPLAGPVTARREMIRQQDSNRARPDSLQSET